MQVADGRRRVVIENVRPEVDAGRFPIKRTAGETVQVEADVFTDGHDAVRCLLLYRSEESPAWQETSMTYLGNDRWRGVFTVPEVGRYRYTVEGWADPVDTWRQDVRKKIDAGTDTPVDFLIGARFIQEAASRAAPDDQPRCLRWAGALASDAVSLAEKRALALAEELALVLTRYPDRRLAVTYGRELEVVVDPRRAGFSSWYEFFPRSCAPQPGRHAAFRDCEARLEYVASMGFDVVYLPPIHPVGYLRRKGRNNVPASGSDDVGSPWGIGSPEGGHKAVHPLLGTLEDFQWFLEKARGYGLEVALDVAFQCAPDHPYLAEHREWFRQRPDGTVQYAENPPKKYQDIYPFDFETGHWRELWEELKSVFDFWIQQGVRIFRVDNPHTKPFRFWEWAIDDLKRRHPGVIFLSEAFTRPKVMYRLAKLGFTQSYTYFAWRNTKYELTQYFTELTRSELREFFRPNLWPNTPDILTEYLQFGGRPAFMARLVLAATLGANYGIYGPAFELCENRAREPGSEEYLDSEKYELKRWNLEHPDSLRDFIASVNRIRRQNPALQSDRNLRFHEVDNEQLVCYSKHTEDLGNAVLVVVNLDPHHRQAGWIQLDPAELGLDPVRPYQMHDLLSEARYLWQGPRNYVELDPKVMPAHIFQLRRWVRTERQFDYYM